MTKRFAMPALVALLAASVAVDVRAFERKGSFTGPRETSTIEGTGSCSGRACSRDVTKTGPNGSSASRQGGGSCADGTCSGGRTTTGPAGRVFTREGSISR